MWEYRYSDELYHYGVKGMKWGVRKKQDHKSGRTSNKKKDENKEKQKGLTDKQKESYKNRSYSCCFYFSCNRRLQSI